MDTRQSSQAIIENAYAGKSENFIRIISALEQLLQHKRLSNITVRELCQAANVSTGTFYHYFDSKEDVIAEKTMLENNYKTTEIKAIIDGLHPYDQVIAFATFYANMNQEAGLDTVSSLTVPGAKSFRARQPMVDVLEDILENGQSQKVFTSRLSKTYLAELMMNVLRGTTHCWCMEHGHFDLAARITHLVRILLQSFMFTDP